MKFLSTRGGQRSVSLSQAIEQGIARDGGLFMPESIPAVSSVARPLAASEGKLVFSDVAREVIAPYAAGDGLGSAIPQLCATALDFPVPLRWIDEHTGVLELFHGPTAAFKDAGARFLAACLEQLKTPGAHRRTVLVATSGDTGGAVASAFYQRDDARVVILYPDGGVSPEQEHQLTCWGGNVQAFAVQGSFDDCQRLVKAAFADDNLRASCRLTSANSINIGRLLPQIAYYAYASLVYVAQRNDVARFVVPSGNAGNVVACLMAKRMGYPIGKVCIASNANKPLLDFLSSGTSAARPSIATLANAMDVGSPSNLERLRVLYPDIERLQGEVCAFSCDDAHIVEQITSLAACTDYIVCPHTACGIYARKQLQSNEDWIVAATAHPAKFSSVVEPLLGHQIEKPEALLGIAARQSNKTTMQSDLVELQHILAGK